MLRVFGIDIKVYERQDKIESYLVSIFIIIISGLTALIVSKFAITGSISLYRAGGVLFLPCVYLIIYLYYYSTRKDTLKLYLAAISFGILIGAFLFIMIVLVSDLDLMFLAIRTLPAREKFSVLSNYITSHYLQYIPSLAFLFITNLIRIQIRGKFNDIEKNSGIYGSAMFADSKYLKDNNLINEKYSLLGRDIKTNNLLSFPLCNRTVISKPGGGKTTGITIPALLTENRPVFVHDPKGELWATTARFRMQNFKRKIITIDPFKVTCQSGFPSINQSRNYINPLVYLPESDAYRDRFLSTLISSVVKTEASRSKSEATDHFIEHTQLLLGSLIEFVIDIKNNNSSLRKEIEEILQNEAISDAESKITHIPEHIKELVRDQSPVTLQDALDFLGQTIQDLSNDMRFMLENGSIRQKQAAATFLSTGEAERGSILSTTRRQLMWLADNNLRETFIQNNCNLKDFITGAADIYVIMPEDQINTQSRCIRMILSLVQSLLIQEPIQNLPDKQYLFILDELGQLDYNPDVEQAIAILRGRKCVFWSVFQTYSQIEQYRKPDLFIDTGILQFFSIGDPKIMQLIQKLGGKQTKLIERNNHSRSSNKAFGSMINGSTGESSSSSIVEVQTDLIHMNEIRELPKNEQYVFIDGYRPIHCKKLQYYKDQYFKDYDKNPIEARG